MNRYASIVLILALAGAAAQQAIAADGSVKPGDAVSLNPQPEPPGITAKTIAMRKAGGDSIKLNPQPEPPGIAAPKAKLAASSTSNPGTTAK